MDTLEIAWLAGVLESKGSLEIDKRGGIRIRVRSGNEWLLKRVASTAKGKVSKGRDLAVISGHDAAHALMMTYTLLSPDKRTKAKLLIGEYNRSKHGKKVPVFEPPYFPG